MKKKDIYKQLQLTAILVPCILLIAYVFYKMMVTLVGYLGPDAVFWLFEGGIFVVLCWIIAGVILHLRRKDGQ